MTTQGYKDKGSTYYTSPATTPILRRSNPTTIIRTNAYKVWEEMVILEIPMCIVAVAAAATVRSRGVHEANQIKDEIHERERERRQS
jgi:hypothetical protein